MNEKKLPGVWRVIKSVAGSFFGVQSSKNWEHDFTHGKAVHFIVAGLIGTALFVLLLVGVVRLILHLAGV